MKFPIPLGMGFYLFEPTPDDGMGLWIGHTQEDFHWPGPGGVSEALKCLHCGVQGNYEVEARAYWFTTVLGKKLQGPLEESRQRIMDPSYKWAK